MPGAVAAAGHHARSGAVAARVDAHVPTVNNPARATATTAMNASRPRVIVPPDTRGGKFLACAPPRDWMPNRSLSSATT